MGIFAFVLPVLVLLSGVLLIMRPAFLGETIGMVAGVALMVYGISELISSWKMKQAMDEYDIKFLSEHDNGNDIDEQ